MVGPVVFDLHIHHPAILLSFAQSTIRRLRLEQELHNYNVLPYLDDFSRLFFIWMPSAWRATLKVPRFSGCHNLTSAEMSANWHVRNLTDEYDLTITYTFPPCTFQVKEEFCATFAGRVVSLRPTLRECADGKVHVSVSIVSLTSFCVSYRVFSRWLPAWLWRSRDPRIKCNSGIMMTLAGNEMVERVQLSKFIWIWTYYARETNKHFLPRPPTRSLDFVAIPTYRTGFWLRCRTSLCPSKTR